MIFKTIATLRKLSFQSCVISKIVILKTNSLALMEVQILLKLPAF
jgi:hypothetical protein